MNIMARNLTIWILSLFSFSYANLLTGLDVFEESNMFRLFYNKNIALVVNHTSTNKDGVHILDLLLEHKDINIISIFTPEHGLKGDFSAGEKIFNAFDKNSGIKIVSLYGDKKQPDAIDLEGIDYIVFDIQDIGSRYYTYVSTLTYVLNASAINNVPIIVLDRPNPLGREVSGPIISSEFYSFVGMHPIPIRHGMTIGELATMINKEGWLPSSKKAKLRIIPMRGWDTFPGYFSIPPSPNIIDFETAVIYNGMCLLEGTNVSEGRGTDNPFLLFGAPWMNSKLILEDLISFKHAGVIFSEEKFKPISSKRAKYPKYKNQLCNGIKIDVIYPLEVNPLKISIFILKTIYKHHPEDFSFNSNDFIANLYGSVDIKKNIINQSPMQNLIDVWIEDSISFNSVRKSYLMY